MITYESGSNIIPVDIDDFSSPTTVYRNYNIVRIEKTDEQTGEIKVEYSYMVDHYDREEWYQLYPNGYIDDSTSEEDNNGTDVDKEKVDKSNVEIEN